MGTSNWQNIPYNVEVLMKIAPQRVLDVGVGYGRWGMIVREFCDVWNGRVLKRDWLVNIEGIEAFEENIEAYHASFYNVIHKGDARDILPTLEGPWNVVIFGDVLEHFERDVAESLLTWCLEHSDYVMVNIPLGSEWPQSDIYENPYEEHLSVWVEADFAGFNLVRHARFLDFMGRPFGVFVLSRNDPKNLRDSLFSVLPSLAFHDGLQADVSSVYIETVAKRNWELQKNNEALQQDNTLLAQNNERLVGELAEIKNSRSYLLIERLQQSPAKALLMKLVQLLVRRPDSQPVTTEASSDFVSRNNTTRREVFSSGRASPVTTEARSDADHAWLEQYRANPGPLSINHPDWRGVLSSARQLFDSLFLLPDDLDENKALRYAQLFCDAQPPSITIQGFPLTYAHLVRALKKLVPDLPIFVIWHGNFLHSREDYAWQGLSLVKSLADEGAVTKVGFVKKGMAEVMRSTGMNAHFVTNLVRRIPTQPSMPLSGGPHIGVWADPDYEWKKLPYAMLAALSLLPRQNALVVNVSERAKTFGDWFHLQAEYQTRVMPNAQVMAALPKMHLNLNVSLTECAPMLPLESLSLGSPCLFGPTSHYFLDHEYLHSRLVVPYPDDSIAIARSIEQVLDERDEIIHAYAAYAPGYNRRALQLLSEFLEYPLGAEA